MKPLGAWDYVIVGAGTAGCVLANRLSADPDVTPVAEAGGKDDSDRIDIPVGYLYCIGNPRKIYRRDRTEPDPGLNGRSNLYARGKVLGGPARRSTRCCISAASGVTTTNGRASPATARGRGRACYRSSSARRTTTVARATCTRPAANGALERQRLSWTCSILPRGDGAGGHSEGGGLQRRRQRGRRVLRGEPAPGVRWSAAKGFQTCDEPSQPYCHDGRTREPAPARRQAGRRRRAPTRRRGRLRRRAHRRELRGRGDRLATDPSALRNRAGGAAAGARHPGRARSAGRWGEPPGPPPAPHGVQGEERRDDEPACREPLGQGGDGARVRVPPHLFAHHGTEPARLREERPVAADRERRVSRPAALARQVRRSAAPFSAITASACNLRPTSRGYVRNSLHARAHPAINPGHLFMLEDRKIAATPCGSPAGSRRSPRSRATSRRSSSPESSSRRTTSLRRPRATSAPRSSTRSERAR